MKYTFPFFALCAASLIAGASLAQEDNTVSTAELFSSMISNNSGGGNASDFQNSAPRADWGNPIFGEKMISITLGTAILQRQHDNDSFLPLNGMSGLELDARVHLRAIQLEFGWLGVFSGDDTRYLPALSGGSLPTSPPIMWTANGLLSTQYQSDLHSFDFNLRLPMSDNFTGILGLRYINLHETVQLEETSPTQVLGWNTTTSNNLFGAQTGGDITFARYGGFQMNAVGKAGIFVNSIDQDGMIVGFPSPGSVLVDDGTSKVAFLGEFKLTGTYRFTNYLAVTAGYQALWISNVALGQNQISAINFANGGGIHSSASPLFHGATAQAVVSW